MGSRALSGALVVAALLVLGGCGDDAPSSPAEAEVPGGISVTSGAFGEGDPIPPTYTCDGDEVSPPLAWSGIPPAAAALALVVDDPDAPSGTFTHWVVVDIPVGTTSSPQGGTPGGVAAENSAGDATYAGPCPPSGTHHYRFTIVALDAETGLAVGASLADALSAVDQHALARGTLTGTYARR